MSSRTEVLAAGVTGVSSVGDSEPQLQTPVLAFAQWGDVMFVGGKFTSVQRADGTLGAQSYLAAFDRRTGNWIDTFRPVLDGAVWDMAIVDGKLIVGGQFLSVNGAASTTALAALDPASGQVLPGWQANIGITGTSQRPLVRALDVEGPWVYIGGSFTRVTGLDGVTHNVSQLTRVAVSNGAKSATFAPNVTGRVYDIDATPTKIYAVGKFTAVNGIPQSMFTGLFPSTGMVDTALKQKVDSDYRPDWSYQQAVLAVGDEVWISGSQHDTQVYRASDFSLVRAFASVPWGDGQALAKVGDTVFNGSHATDGTKMYFDVSLVYNGSWQTKNASGSAPVKWIGAWKAGDDHAFRTDWYTQAGTRYGEGAWELFGDSSGCLWAGGDFNRGSYDGNTPRFAGGFVKFCSNDGVAPSVPTGVVISSRADGIQLVWPASTDDRPGPVTYDVFRDDTQIATGLVNRTFVDAGGTATSRYFVRAVDQAGNRSATTPVLRVPADSVKPTTPQSLAATVQRDGSVTATWTAATDNVGVTAYAVYRNGVELVQVPGPTATLTGLGAGTHYVQVQAIDAAGNRSAKTPSVTVVITAAGADTSKPSTPKDLAATVQPTRDVAVTWTAATDDVGVVAYVVFANGTEATRVTGTSATLTGLAGGTWSVQVQALDAAGNGSSRTAPVSVVVPAAPGPDTTKPTTPKDLTATVLANGDVQLSWTAATDDVGVVAYAVYRNNVELLQVTGNTARLTGLAAGTHYVQVQAIDGAGNRGNKTAPLTVVK